MAEMDMRIETTESTRAKIAERWVLTSLPPLTW